MPGKITCEELFRLETRADIELFARRAAKRMTRRAQAFAALHERRIRPEQGDAGFDGFLEAMNRSEREHFERLRARLAPEAKRLGEGDYLRAKDGLSDEFDHYHETEGLVQSLADLLTEDAVLGHLLRDSSAKGYSEPPERSGMTQIGYDMLYYGNLTSARAEADARSVPLEGVLEQRRSENSDLIREVRNCIRYGDAFDNFRAMFDAAPERRPLKGRA